MNTDRTQLNVAVVGALGRQGKRRVDAVSRVEGLRLLWVVGRAGSLEALKEVALKRGCTASESWQDPVNDPATNLVVVCTPNRDHCEVAVRALEKGKHVLVEKPLAGSMEEATRIVDAARDSSSRLKTGLNYPYRAPIKRALEELRRGAVGEPTTIRAHIGHSQFAAGAGASVSWFLDPDTAGRGALLDLGVHVVDLARRVFDGCADTIQSVVALTAGGRGPGAADCVLENDAMALYRTRHGRLFSLHASWCDFRRYLGLRFEVLGSGGRIELDLTTRTTTVFMERGGELVEDVTTFDHVEPDPSWSMELEDFRDAILAGKGVDGDGAAGLSAQRLVFAAYESARVGGQPVTLVASG